MRSLEYTQKNLLCIRKRSLVYAQEIFLRMHKRSLVYTQKAYEEKGVSKGV